MAPQVLASPTRRGLVAIVLIVLALAAAAMFAAYVHHRQLPPGPLPPKTTLEAACRQASTPSKCRAVELFDRPTYDVGFCIWEDGACRFFDEGAAA